MGKSGKKEKKKKKMKNRKSDEDVQCYVYSRMSTAHVWMQRITTELSAIFRFFGFIKMCAICSRSLPDNAVIRERVQMELQKCEVM